MDDFKLRIESKKLDSGRFQVKFSMDEAAVNDRGNSEQYYGYLLAEPKTPLREIVQKITRHLEAMRSTERYYQRNLFSLTHREANSGRILIFKSNPKPGYGSEKRAA